LIHVTVTTSPKATRFGIIAPQDLRNIEILTKTIAQQRSL